MTKLTFSAKIIVQNTIVSVDNQQRSATNIHKLLSSDPFVVFSEWYISAVNPRESDSNSMYLATCTVSGKPSLRTVLLKGVEDNSFIFFTNYQSRKGDEIDQNPFVALLFHWAYSGKQVRVEGKAEKISETVSDAYFNSRPILSKISAVISAQSKVISGRNELTEAWLQMQNIAETSGIKRPTFWGGYRVIPDSFEFWIAGDHRLHHRTLYERSGYDWVMKILAP